MTQDKLLKIAARLYRGDAVTTELLRSRYRCSPAGAKRAMRKLRENLPVEAEREGQRTVLRIRQAPKVAPTTWMQL